jgi:hypothetical protein
VWFELNLNEGINGDPPAHQVQRENHGQEAQGQASASKA